MKTCPDCGCRVYELGCVNCNEVAYIEAQEGFEPDDDDVCGHGVSFSEDCEDCDDVEDDDPSPPSGSEPNR